MTSALLLTLFIISIILLALFAILRRPQPKQCSLLPQIAYPELINNDDVQECKEPLLHESGRYPQSFRASESCIIEKQDLQNSHEIVTQCIGMENVRPPANASEENCRQYIINFVNQLVNHMYQYHTAHPLTLRLVGSWRGNVEIYIQTGVLFYPEHGCFYFNPDIFNSYTFEQLHSAILDELSKPTCSCDVDKVEWEKSYKFLLYVATHEMQIQCSK